MAPDRRQTLAAGIFVILGLAAGLASVSPAIDGHDYLASASDAVPQVKFAAIAQVTMGLALIAFAATIYPLLKQYSQALASFFLGTRIIGAAITMTSTAIMLAILKLSQEAAGLPLIDLLPFDVAGQILKSARDDLNHAIMVIILGFGNSVFYYISYRYTFMPRWISVLGWSGIVLSIIAGMLFLFNKFDVISVGYIALTVPAVVSEFVLAYWLVFRGLRPGPRLANLRTEPTECT